VLAVAPLQPRRRSRLYDHRLRDAVVATGDPKLFAAQLLIPASTTRSWIARGRRRVITLDALDHDAVELRAKIARLKRNLERLRAVTLLLVALIRARGIELAFAQRLPDGAAKRTLLRAIDRARRVMPLAHALRVLRITPARYHTHGPLVKAVAPSRTPPAARALNPRASCPASSWR
jgi:hypothetical protein